MVQERQQKKADTKSSGPAVVVQCYDFGNTPVLLTHPDVNFGEPVRGCFAGNWYTIQTSRSELEITDIDARLVLPPMDVVLPKKRAAIRVTPGSVSLSLGNFDVPDYLQEIFPTPNRGIVDIRNRVYRAVFALQADFSFAYAESDYLNYEPANLLLLTVGTIEKGGALTASGIGRVISGFLSGMMCACCRPAPKPKKVPKCKNKNPKTGQRCVKPKGHKPPHFSKLPRRVEW